jgi:hypothetical protein
VRWVRGTALALFAAAVGVLAGLPLLRPPLTARQIRSQLLMELQPVALKNCTMRRFGSPNDGGYLMCDNLLDHLESAYSYGIGPADAWGCDVAERYHLTVHQYDCFTPPVPACPNGHSVFHDECVGPARATRGSKVFDTLSDQIAKNGDAGRRLVVKIDIEGAELPSLMATSDEVLDRFDQLAMEIHGTNRWFLDMVRKLKRTFYVVHLHFNNNACTIEKSSPIPASAYQVLLVNKRIAVLDPTRTPILPNPLDAPDNARGPDCQAPGALEQ